MNINPDGQLLGSASGKVDAPIYHDGAQDVSSGIGSISGQLTGSLASGSSSLVLAQPVIDMHWGTFNGHEIERWITMPDYQLAIAGTDCVSTHGSIAEQGFPLQNITNDSSGQLAQAPGIGVASGTWQLTSDESAKYQDLSQQVDAFIGGANAVLGDSSSRLTPFLVDARIEGPLMSLENTISQDPDVSRCLLARLHAWEASVVPELLQRALVQPAPDDIVALRASGDLVRSALILAQECGISDGGAETAILDGERTSLDRAITSRDWPNVALLLREMLLLAGSSAHPKLEQQVAGDLHALLTGVTTDGALLEIGRVAYAVGDDADAQGAANAMTSHLRPRTAGVPWVLGTPGGKKHPRTPRPKRPKQGTKPGATPTPTPTSPPTTLLDVLTSGVPAIGTNSTAGSPPVLSWEPVADAARYVVFVTASSGMLWSWSGTGTSVTYGDTAIAGTAGTENEGWPIPLDANASWSTLALNAQGQIVGLKVRMKL